MAQTQTIQQATKAWATDRNTNQRGVGWQFTNEKARTKLKRLYPKIEE